MKSNILLGPFVTFILLLELPKNEVVAGSNLIHTQPAAADLLPLTRFLRAILDRVRAHEQVQAGQTHPVETVFQDRHTGVRLRRNGQESE
jgi:hypothetical protein